MATSAAKPIRRQPWVPPPKLDLHADSVGKRPSTRQCHAALRSVIKAAFARGMHWVDIGLICCDTGPHMSIFTVNNEYSFSAQLPVRNDASRRPLARSQSAPQLSRLQSAPARLVNEADWEPLRPAQRARTAALTQYAAMLQHMASVQRPATHSVSIRIGAPSLHYSSDGAVDGFPWHEASNFYAMRPQPSSFASLGTYGQLIGQASMTIAAAVALHAWQHGASPYIGAGSSVAVVVSLRLGLAAWQGVGRARWTLTTASQRALIVGHSIRAASIIYGLTLPIRGDSTHFNAAFHALQTLWYLLVVLGAMGILLPIVSEPFCKARRPDLKDF